jgi:hypothetical protein
MGGVKHLVAMDLKENGRGKLEKRSSDVYFEVLAIRKRIMC